MDLTTIITIAGLVVANIGTTIFLFTWATGHAAEDSREVRRIIDGNAAASNAILKSIADEMKDFHGRMERQDAEFRAHMMHLHNHGSSSN